MKPSTFFSDKIIANLTCVSLLLAEVIIMNPVSAEKKTGYRLEWSVATDGTATLIDEWCNRDDHRSDCTKTVDLEVNAFWEGFAVIGPDSKVIEGSESGHLNYNERSEGQVWCDYPLDTYVVHPTKHDWKYNYVMKNPGSFYLHQGNWPIEETTENSKVYIRDPFFFYHPTFSEWYDNYFDSTLKVTHTTLVDWSCPYRGWPGEPVPPHSDVQVIDGIQRWGYKDLFPYLGNIEADDNTNTRFSKKITIKTDSLYSTDSRCGVLPVPCREEQPAEAKWDVRIKKIEFPELVGIEVTQALQNWRNDIPLVENKDTYVRVFFAVSDSYGLRDISGRLSGTRNGQSLKHSGMRARNVKTKTWPIDQLARKRISTSLNFRLPKSWRRGTVTLTFEADKEILCAEYYTQVDSKSCSVEVTFQPAKVPDIIYFNVIWQDASGNQHSTNTSQIKELKRRLRALFPTASLTKHRIRKIDRTIENPLPTDPTAGLLARLMAIRSNDNCFPQPPYSCNTIYHAVLAGTKGGGKANMAPYTAVDPLYSTAQESWSDPAFGSYPAFGKYTHAHEIAHNLFIHHPVNQNIFGTATIQVQIIPGVYENRTVQLGPCGESAYLPASTFPYIYKIDNNPKHKAYIGPMWDKDRVVHEEIFYGFDTYMQWPISPYDHFELMSYCGPNFRWVSQDTYAKLWSAIGNTWKKTITSTRAGAADKEYLLVRGSVDIVRDTAEFMPFGKISAAPDLLMPTTGEYLLSLTDVAGNIIAEQPFDLELPEVDTVDINPWEAPFLIPIVADPEIERVAVMHNGNTLALMSSSANPPVVQLIHPNGGEIFSEDSVLVEWSGNDVDGDTLSYVIQYSADGGDTWQTIDVDRTEPHYEIDRTLLRGSNNGMIRVKASDGFHTATDESDNVFSVANHSPEVVIISPLTNTSYSGDQIIFFEAETYDIEDVEFLESSISWHSSLDGELATGALITIMANELSPGEHRITLEAEDTGGIVVNASVLVRIEEEALFRDDFE